MLEVTVTYLWTGGEGVAGGGVLDPPALLEEESAEPPVLALVVLDVVLGERGQGGVGPHHVVAHHGPASEEREAAGTAENTAQHVLCCLLQPVTNRILELLIPKIILYWRSYFSHLSIRASQTIQCLFERASIFDIVTTACSRCRSDGSCHKPLQSRGSSPSCPRPSAPPSAGSPLHRRR